MSQQSLPKPNAIYSIAMLETTNKLQSKKSYLLFFPLTVCQRGLASTLVIFEDIVNGVVVLDYTILRDVYTTYVPLIRVL